MLYREFNVRVGVVLIGASIVMIPCPLAEAQLNVDFSNVPDKAADGSGGLGAASPQQVLFTIPPDRIASQSKCADPAQLRIIS